MLAAILSASVCYTDSTPQIPTRCLSASVLHFCCMTACEIVMAECHQNVGTASSFVPCIWILPGKRCAAAGALNVSDEVLISAWASGPVGSSQDRSGGVDSYGACVSSYPYPNTLTWRAGLGRTLDRWARRVCSDGKNALAFLFLFSFGDCAMKSGGR